MTRTTRSLVFAATALLAACNSDNTAGPAARDEIVGTWISTGRDMAPGVVTAFDAAQVTATFRRNRTYSIEITDSLNVRHTLSGTWQAEPSGPTIRSVTLYQTVPDAQVDQGTFRVDGERLSFQVTLATPAAVLARNAVASATLGAVSEGGYTPRNWDQFFWSERSGLKAAPCNPEGSTWTGKQDCESQGWHPGQQDKGKSGDQTVVGKR